MVSFSVRSRVGRLRNWGATPEERLRAYPADALLPEASERLTRAVSVAAAPEILYRWLCQMQVAPYSYDLVDNFGRRSPPELTPGAEHLSVGQTLMVVFRLTDVQSGRMFTGLTRPSWGRLFGQVAVTYAAEAVDETHARLVSRMVFASQSRLGRARAVALTWGDLVMLRRQLLNLKGYAERDATRDSAASVSPPARPQNRRGRRRLR